MPAPTIESHAQAISTGGTTATIAVTAAGAGRVIIVLVGLGLASTALNATLSISGGGANVGAWTQIAQVPNSGTPLGMGVSAWYAVTTGAVSAQTVTITSTATLDDTAKAYVTVAGANTTAPLDLNSVLAQGGGNIGTGARGASGPVNGTSTTAISTNTANVLSFVILGNDHFSNSPTVVAGSTATEYVVNPGGARYACLTVMTRPFTSVQSGTAVGCTNIDSSSGFAFGITA